MKATEKVYIISKSYGESLERFFTFDGTNPPFSTAVSYKTIPIDGLPVKAFIGYYVRPLPDRISFPNGHVLSYELKVPGGEGCGVLCIFRPGDYFHRKDFLTEAEYNKIINQLPEELFEI